MQFQNLQIPNSSVVHQKLKDKSRNLVIVKIILDMLKSFIEQLCYMERYLIKSS